MGTKIGQYEERVSLLTEQLSVKEGELKQQMDQFDQALRASQKYFEETLQEKDADISRFLCFYLQRKFVVNKIPQDK